MRPARSAASILATALLLLLSGCAAFPRAAETDVAFAAAVRVEPTVAADRSYTFRDADMPDVLTVEIARWYGDADAAVSITFDDGTLDQYLLALPELEAHGMRATFFLIPGFMDSGIWDDSGTPRLLFGWNAARTLHRLGHEIGAHTMTHRDLSRAGRDRIFWELSESRQQLEARIPGARVRTLAWPYWRSSTEGRAVAAELFTASRGGAASVDRFRSVGIPPARPPDPQAVNALALLPAHDPEGWVEIADELAAVGGWGVLSLHGVTDGRLSDLATGWQPLPLSQLTAIFAALGDERYWVAPFGTVMDYIVLRDATSLTRVRTPLDGERRPVRFAVSRTASESPNEVVEPGFVTAVLSGEGGAACLVTVYADQRSLPVHCRAGRAVFNIPDQAEILELWIP